MATKLPLQPHVAEVIEPGAILCSSWGYEQTNINYYMVTRTTKSSAWIVPMTSHEEQTGFMSGQASPLLPKFVSDWCECGHRVHNHGTVLNMTGPDYSHCRGAFGDECECTEVRTAPIKPEMHRIRRETWGGNVHESLTLTSYSHASLWDGASKYASHYA